MPDTNANPSLDPADNDTLKGTFRTAFRKLMQGTDGMLPCKVIAATADRKYVTVQPMVSVVATDGTVTQRAQITQVPVLQMGGGNYVLSFPVAADDLGWILANDRDISAYIQTSEATPPNTGRMQNFSDAVFIPDKARQWSLDGGDADAAVWQSLDGTIKVAVSEGSITLKHPTTVIIDSPLSAFVGEIQVADGIGFFGADPGAKPSITGALSSVTDANAKAVLTSLVAALSTGSGQATNSTT